MVESTSLPIQSAEPHVGPGRGQAMKRRLDGPCKPSPTTSKAPAGPGLSPYTRSLLRIRVPVVVTVARKREPLGRIVALNPGSIIRFDTSCDEMLELSVGNRPIACGEAVQMGEQLGLRITSMTRPGEPLDSSPQTRPDGG